jgi:hypothetical protein
VCLKCGRRDKNQSRLTRFKQFPSCELIYPVLSLRESLVGNLRGGTQWTRVLRDELLEVFHRGLKSPLDSILAAWAPGTLRPRGFPRVNHPYRLAVV